MNPDLLQLVKLKKSLYNKNRSTKWRYDHLNLYYRKVCKNLKKLCKLALANYEFQLVKDKHNPKRLFAYVKSQQNSYSSIDSLSVHNAISTDRLEIANALNNQFHSVFVKESPSDLPSFPSRTSSNLDSISFSVHDISKHLAQLKAHKSIGPDGISPYVLRFSAHAFVAPLKLIFSMSFDQGAVPHDWSDAHITPIYKDKGNKTDPSNYRPSCYWHLFCVKSWKNSVVPLSPAILLPIDSSPVGNMVLSKTKPVTQISLSVLTSSLAWPPVTHQLT